MHSGKYAIEDYSQLRHVEMGRIEVDYEFTVDDPDYYTASWSGEVPFLKMDELIYEYACHEANYSLFNVLSGARAQESMAQESQKD